MESIVCHSDVGKRSAVAMWSQWTNVVQYAIARFATLRATYMVVVMLALMKLHNSLGMIKRWLSHQDHVQQA